MSSQEAQIHVPIQKIDEDQKCVFGWASIVKNEDGSAVVDSHEDIIEIAELEDAVYEFVLSYAPTAGVEHRYPCGQLIESMVFTKAKLKALNLPEDSTPEGWWVGFKIWDEDVWLKVKSGKLTDFSIGGTGVRVPADETETIDETDKT